MKPEAEPVSPAVETSAFYRALGKSYAIAVSKDSFCAAITILSQYCSNALAA